MHFVMDTLDAAERYKLLVNTVTPRPIAWVLTRRADGSHNAAPYSFFNAMGGTPPLLAIGMASDSQRGAPGPKDSLQLVRDNGEFTVALVSQAHLAAMNLTAINAPAEVDELALAGLATLPATQVAAPLLQGVPAQFECRVWQIVETGPHSAIVLGEVLVTHIADRFVSWEEGRLRIDNPAMQLVGRTYGAGEYLTNSGPAHIDRASWPLKG